MTELCPFRLDPANQCLWRRTGTGEEERVLLTRTEFAVLDHLVARAGQLVFEALGPPGSADLHRNSSRALTSSR
jgi:DNA-binding response OmpR family regulator